MPAEYQCPACKSPSIDVGVTVAVCHNCGHREELIDYPVSWDWWRGMRIRDGLSDPGSNRPMQQQYPDVNVLTERIEMVEGALNQPAWVGKQWDRVQQIDAGFKHLQSKLNEHIISEEKQKEEQAKDKPPKVKAGDEERW